MKDREGEMDRTEEERTHPLAMAPTKTAIECVSGSVGRNWDNRIVGASADRAGRQCRHSGLRTMGIRKTEKGRVDMSEGHTEFDGIRGEMVSDWVLAIS